MNIIIVGEGARAAWVERTFGRLRALAGPAGEGKTHWTGGGADPGELQAFAREPIDAVVVVDAARLVQSSAHDPAAWREAVHRDAIRAIYVRELAARAGCRVIPLVGNEMSAWLGALASLLSLADVDSVDAEVLPSFDVLATADLPLVACYLDPLWASIADRGRLVVVWPRECFLNGDAVGEPLPLVMELAGHGRILSYGPYLPLPAGHWRATAWLGFSPDNEKLPFIFEAFTPPSITRGFFEVEAGGFFTLELDFQVTDPFTPIEMRLVSQESAFTGQAALIEVRLELAEPPSGVRTQSRL